VTGGKWYESLADILRDLPESDPADVERVRQEGYAAREAGVARWDNPYRASCDAWHRAWESGWDASRVDVLVSRDGP